MRVIGRCQEVLTAVPHRTASAAVLRRPSFVENFNCVQRALGSFLVLEIGEDISPALNMLPDSADHGATLFRRVRRLSIAVIREIRGDDIRRNALLSFGDAKRAVVSF